LRLVPVGLWVVDLISACCQELFILTMCTRFGVFLLSLLDGSSLECLLVLNFFKN
jgi:hypothetical protein